ncbi:hypothetical protein ACJX0J_041424, partial [Zea mays]
MRQIYYTLDKYYRWYMNPFMIYFYLNLKLEFWAEFIKYLVAISGFELSLLKGHYWLPTDEARSQLPRDLQQQHYYNYEFIYILNSGSCFF